MTNFNCQVRQGLCMKKQDSEPWCQYCPNLLPHTVNIATESVSIWQCLHWRLACIVVFMWGIPWVYPVDWPHCQTDPPGYTYSVSYQNTSIQWKLNHQRRIKASQVNKTFKLLKHTLKKNLWITILIFISHLHSW